MTSRFKDHILGPDTHANRPAASGVPEASLYECTTHGLIYKNVSSAWVTYGVLIPPGGTAGQALVKNSGTDYDIAWGAGGGGGSTYSTYDAAVSGLLTGVVHRWKFDETSGTTVADSVGSLPLTLAGTYTRNITSKTGVATNFVSATATATGSGSVPTGNNARCFIALLRSTSLAEQGVFSYGTPNSTNRIWMTGAIGTQSDSPNATTPGGGLYTWGDDLGNVGMGQSVRGNEWHLMAWGYDGNKGGTLFIDGITLSLTFGANLATATGTNFQIGKSNYSGRPIPLLGDVDDFLVMDNWPGIAKLRKFHRALQDVI